MPTSSDTAIVIPAWNEASTIERVVKSVVPFGIVVVVDDESTDATAEIAQHAGAVVVAHTENQGYDGALNSGFIEAEKLGVEFIITFDADGQHACGDLELVLQHLREGADLVVGVRPARARISEKLFALVTRKLYGLQDPLCGLKGYRRSLYRAAGCFDSCRSIGSQLALFGYKTLEPGKIKSVPVAIHPRTDQPRLGSCLRANVKIIAGLCRVLAHIRG